MQTDKKIYVAIIIALVIIVLIIPYPAETTLPKRQDPNMDVGETINIDLEKFINNLEALKALNDSVVDAYISAIEKAISAGDYETANELLKQLQCYLKEKYGDELFTDNPDLAGNISLIMSTKNITDTGASIDIVDFIEKYGKLLNSTSLIDLAEKIKYNPAELTNDDIKRMYELISSLHGETRGAFELPEIPENISHGLGGLELPPVSEFPTLHEAPMSDSSLLAPTIIQPTSSCTFLRFLAISIIAALVFFLIRYRQQIHNTLSESFKKIVFKSKDYLDLVLGTRIDDPIVQIYRRLLFYLRLHGYKRKHYETLREFTTKIGEKELRNIVFKATEAYEERIYGNRPIEERKLRELGSLINKILRGI